MISDTLRQKFIYSTPYSDDGLPLVVLDEIRDDESSGETISGKSLYFWERDDFERFVSTHAGKTKKVIIINDYDLKSSSKRLEDVPKCYLMSFACLFKKPDFFVLSVKQGAGSRFQ